MLRSFTCSAESQAVNIGLDCSYRSFLRSCDLELWFGSLGKVALPLGRGLVGSCFHVQVIKLGFQH